MKKSRAPDIDIGLKSGDRKKIVAGLSALLATADLLTQRLEVHEKTAWMLRSTPES